MLHSVQHFLVKTYSSSHIPEHYATILLIAYLWIKNVARNAT